MKKLSLNLRTVTLVLMSFVLVTSLLFFFACDNPNQSIPDDEESTGTVSISVPAYAPLLEAISSDPAVFSFGSRSLADAESRAFAVAGIVELSVYDSASDLLDSEEFTPGSFADEGLNLTMELPVGTGAEIGRASCRERVCQYV